MTTAFIEKQFPVSKVSKESYKERYRQMKRQIERSDYGCVENMG